MIHHDHGDLANAFDFWPVFEKPASGAHVYCCGPRALMDGVRDMTGHWPAGTVHFEFRRGSVACGGEHAVQREARGDPAGPSGFRRTARSSRFCRDNSIRAPSSCESGTCGSCRTTLCAGEADHRDMVLSDDEKRDQIMICVSRAKSEELVLDL